MRGTCEMEWKVKQKVWGYVRSCSTLDASPAGLENPSSQD